MSNPHRWLTVFFLFQWGIMLLVGFVYFFINLAVFKKRRKREDAKTQLIVLLEDILKKQIPYVAKNLPKKYAQVACLTPCIEHMDKIYSSHSSWHNLRLTLMEDYLLLRARLMTKSFSYTQRMWAVRIFLLDPKPRDETFIKILLKDPVSIIRQEAVVAAVRIGSKGLVDQMIDTMTEEAPFAKFPYRDAMAVAGEDVFRWVRERLLVENDEAKKVSCWLLLGVKEDQRIAQCAGKDLFSPNKELRIAVVKALAVCPGEEAASMLISCLEDPQWEIRAAAAKSLGSMNDKRATAPLGRAIRDKNWWVRFNSAQTLSIMGEQEILRRQTLELDRYAYEASQFALKHTELRDV